MIDTSQITEHMEVVGSDGRHIGTVDHVALLLTKTDPAAQGRHHVFKIELAASIQDGKVMMGMPAAEVMQQVMMIEA